MADLYMAEIQAYDPSVPGVITVRAATKGFTTGPAETPANTPYDYRLKQPVNVQRDAFAAGTTSGQSRVGFGDLILSNGDGGLDALAGYCFDGRAVTIRYATKDAPAYPGDFTTVFVGTMEQAQCGMDEIRIRLRDRQSLTQVPYQTNKYLGNNSLPAGLEGVADDLAGKPKPICLGSVLNVPAPCVNTPKLIHQVHDGAVASIDMVYDRGIALSQGVAAWTKQTSDLSPATTFKYECAYGGKYVTVAENGQIETSSDGVTWMRTNDALGGALTNPFGGARIQAVIYCFGLYVAGADDGTLCTNPNGIGTNWTSRTSNLTNILGFVYSPDLDLLLCLGKNGANGRVATSTDGITWSAAIDAGFGTDAVQRGCWSDDLKCFCVVGGSGKVAISPDGTTWTACTLSPFGTTAAHAVQWGHGLFVACADSGKWATSVDGLNWILRTAFWGTQNLNNVIFADGLFFMVGNTNPTTTQPLFATSRDGLVWADRAVPAATWGNTPNAAVWGANKFVVVGTDILTSDVSGGVYASLADLSDDSKAPSPGLFKQYVGAEGSYFRLSVPPAGLVTADVIQGAAAADRTAAQLAGVVLDRAITGETFDATDVSDLDTADSSVCGFWQGTEETTCAAVLDKIAGTVGAWWGCDALGVFRIKQLVRPTGTAAATFTANDVQQGSLQRLATLDAGNGLPVYQVTLRWGKNYAVQDTDLAGGVTAARRGVVSKEWREAAASDAFVQTAHPLALATTEDTLYSTAADALAEAQRRLALRGGRCDRYELTVALDTETAALDLGDVVSLEYGRFDLAGGKRFVILGVAPDVMRRRVRFTLWGTQQYAYGTAALAVKPTLAGTGTKT